MKEHVDFYRTISRIFSNAVFRSIALDGQCDYVLDAFAKYGQLLDCQTQELAGTTLQKAYSVLSANYRSEYYYKNTIARKLLLGRHSLNTTTLLSEFRVAGSIADLVMLNGTSTVYEIKTELDSPEKLAKQVADYQKAFAKVNIVTHHSLAAKYEKLFKDSPVGLFCLGAKQQLSEVLPAGEHADDLNTEVMLRSLRKTEYAAIVLQLCSALPQVPNTQFFKACLQAISEIDPKAVHDQMVRQLKKRTVAHKTFFTSGQLPEELVHICLCLDLNPAQFANLIHFLNHPVTTCTFPISDANNSTCLPFVN